MRPYRLSLLCLLSLCAVLWLAACGSPDSPEVQVHKAFDRLELAAEARDTGEFMDGISASFRGDYQMGRDELARYLRGYFLANQSIHLLTRVERLEFPTPDEARAEVTVASVGKEADAAAAWDISAELHEYRVVLRNEGGAWKVTYAAPFASH